MEMYLKCTPTIDCDTESVKRKARELTEVLKTEQEKARVLFYFVRDEIKHNPYSPYCYLVDTHGQSPWHFTAQASLDLNPDVIAISHTQ
jgi:hypothetical protein